MPDARWQLLPRRTKGLGARWSPWTPRLRLSFPSASTTCTAGVAAGSGRHVPASVQELRAGRQRGQRHVLLQQDEREAHLRRQGPPLWHHQRRLEAQWMVGWGRAAEAVGRVGTNCRSCRKGGDELPKLPEG